jgi:transcriptional regulator with XRE-family HTH domain
MTTLGQRVRALRRHRKWTQQQLGELLGRSQQEVYRWERGIVRIPAEDLALLARVLGVSILSFFPDDDFPTMTVHPYASLSEAFRACAEHAAAMASAMQDVAQYAEVAPPTNGQKRGKRDEEDA